MHPPAKPPVNYILGQAGAIYAAKRKKDKSASRGQPPDKSPYAKASAGRQERRGDRGMTNVQHPISNVKVKSPLVERAVGVTFIKQNFYSSERLFNISPLFART
jgi:hypothetical protein